VSAGFSCKANNFLLRITPLKFFSVLWTEKNDKNKKHRRRKLEPEGEKPLKPAQPKSDPIRTREKRQNVVIATITEKYVSVKLPLKSGNFDNHS
jgi:hypothetical protein